MKEFYTIDEVCELFGMDKQTLHFESNFYNIRPHKNGDAFGFSCYDVRRLHNFIYLRDQDLIDHEAWK